MPASTLGRLSTIKIRSLRAGRNGADPPDSIADLQCTAAFNVDWYRATLARKRGGCDAVSMTGGSTFSNKIHFLFRHIPGALETAAELWAVDAEATPVVKRLTGGTAWADVTLFDAISGSTQYMQAVSFNGKLFIAYDSAVDRLHVWDGSTVRRSGLQTAPVPTTGAPSGTGVTDTRTYKVAWTKQSAGVTVLRGELGTACAAVILANQTVVITRGTAPGEGETHWELYAASTNGVYYLMATTIIATTTYTDNNATISTTTIAPTVGINTVFPSVKFLTTDGNRILGAGAWESGGLNSRVWFSPVLGDNNVGDDERYVNSTLQKNYVDLNENDGGYITALSVPLLGSIYAFKYRQIHKLTPTGDISTPYLHYEVSRVVGCVDASSLRLGEDQGGRPALYFESSQGPYRIGSNGLEYLGHDIDDLVSTINLAASTKVCHSIYYPEKRQWWLWVATGASNEPDTILVFHPLVGTATEEGIRGGWTVYNGDLAAGRCACVFSNTLGASMSSDLKPYVGRSANNSLLKADTSTTTDNGTTFQAYVTSKVYVPAGEGIKFKTHYPTLVAQVGAAVTITVTVNRDYGLETKSGTVLLTASGAETRKRARAEGCVMSGCQAASFTIGDASAIASAWTIDELIVPFEPEQAA